LFKKAIIILLVFIMTFSFINSIYGAEILATSISINNGTTLYLSIDDFVTLDVKINPTNANSSGITFSSSNPEIANVDYKGNVTAKRVGNSTITAELNGKKSSITVKVSGVNKLLDASFSVKKVSGTDFVEITITPRRYDNRDNLIEDEVDYDYNIYLPSGYFITGKSASYVADRNGVYPFTVYNGNSKRTFYYTVKDIKKTDTKNETNSKYDDDEIDLNYKLMYDYEKKQILFNLELDKNRTVVTPDKKTIVSNIVNYYLPSMKNNSPLDFTVTIDSKTFKYKVIRQGEFYLLISLSPVNYDNYSSIVYYTGYNFTTNENFTATPSKDIFYDNGNYEVMIQSEASNKEIFNFNITGIDFKRPMVKSSIVEGYTIDLEIKDDFGLDYIITFDGKYVSIGGGNQGITSFEYKSNTKVDFNGDYIFTVVDKAGNRTAYAVTIDSRSKRYKYPINYSVHNYKYTKDLFENIGILYDNDDSDDDDLYEIILPSYMKGSNSSYFNPNSNISRAEIVTLFCRITDLPYDTSAFLKTKFTDIEYHWARDYISMGSSKKYVSGYKDKTFRPDEAVTRAEFCQMLSNISAFKSKVSALPATSNYDFLDINSHWARKEIIKIASRDIIIGENSHFYPDKPITRAEVVHAINMVYNLNPTKNELAHMSSVYKKYYNFNDISNNKYYNDIIISIVGMYREKIK